MQISNLVFISLAKTERSFSELAFELPFSVLVSTRLEKKTPLTIEFVLKWPFGFETEMPIFSTVKKQSHNN